MDAHSINTAPAIRAAAPNLRRRLTEAEVGALCSFGSEDSKLETGQSHHITIPKTFPVQSCINMSQMPIIFIIKKVLSPSYRRHAVLKTAGSMSGILDFFHSPSSDVLFNSSTNTDASLRRIRLSTRRIFDS